MPHTERGAWRGIYFVPAQSTPDLEIACYISSVSSRFSTLLRVLMRYNKYVLVPEQLNLWRFRRGNPPLGKRFMVVRL